jgi:transposase-like protein
MSEYVSDKVFDGVRPVTKQRVKKLTSKHVRTKVKQLNAKIEKANKDLRAFQNKCPHINLTKKYAGSDGGWDYDPHYWTDWECHDCGKRWTTDQSYENDKKWPNAINITRMSTDALDILKKLGKIRND